MVEKDEPDFIEEGTPTPVEESGVALAPPPELPGPIDPSRLELRETLVSLNRTAKVVKGGRRFSFAALVVVGDGRGHVGVGFGKANEVPEAIQKGVQSGKRGLIRVPLVGRTVPYQVVGVFGSARVLVKPAVEGTGIIAGPPARAVLELAGVRDVLTKSYGSSNQINVVKATFEALRAMADLEQVARLRGRSLEDMIGHKAAERYRTGRKEALTMKAEIQQNRREERTRRGTYSAGGRDDDEEEAGAAPAATTATT